MRTTRRDFGLYVLLITLAFQSQNKAISETVLWPSDALTKVMRSDEQAASVSDILMIFGARGEVVSSQAVIRVDEDIKAASVGISDLRHIKEKVSIPNTSIRLHWVRYIDIDRNTSGIPEDELVAKAPTSVPDPFWESLVIPLKAQQAQPIWIEIHIPKHAKAGDYEGRLTMEAAARSFHLPVRLHVWDFEIPSERHLSVINWWRFPGLGFEDIEPYTEDYWRLLHEFCTFLVEHRQTDVQTSINLIQERGKIKMDTPMIRAVWSNMPRWRLERGFVGYTYIPSAGERRA